MRQKKCQPQSNFVQLSDNKIFSLCISHRVNATPNSYFPTGSHSTAECKRKTKFRIRIYEGKNADRFLALHCG